MTLIYDKKLRLENLKFKYIIKAKKFSFLGLINYKFTAGHCFYKTNKIGWLIG